MSIAVTYSILPLAEIEPGAVEHLLDVAFGTDRFIRTAYRMRDGVAAIPELSFAAVERGKLLGTLQSWPVMLLTPEGMQHRMTLVGPVAVDPALQRGGIGRALMTQLMNAARDSGYDALVMIGDPEYYGRFFEFAADDTGGWAVPGPVDRRRLLAHVTRIAALPAIGTIIPDTTFASAGRSA
jgi:predicted N-acetyltransferase YhbS